MKSLTKQSIFVSAGCCLGLLLASPALAQRDAIDLSQAVVINSPRDVANWARTTSIRTLTMRPEGGARAGLSFDFPANATWPNYTPPGWNGPIQYTVWAGVQINGVWHVAGFIQMWRERESTGAPLLSFGPGCTVNNFACNWAYSSRWGALAGYQPRAGEAMIFFLTAGNARDVTTVTSVRERSNVVMVNLPANDNGVFAFPTTALMTAGDFDGDGTSDQTVFRPSDGGWFTRLSRGGARVTIWGGSTDIPVPGDYDGDGVTDTAVYKPSNGTWYVAATRWGWLQVQWGLPGDVQVPADYDGDNRIDFAVFRPSNGVWYVRYAAGGVNIVPWGGAGDIPIPGDYDGDGRADFGVYRPSTVTFALRTTNGTVFSMQWGVSTDVPVPADYDGDGRTDLAVFRPSNGTWYIGYSGTRTGTAIQWGHADDVPVQGDFDGDGKVDVAVYRPSTNLWIWRSSRTGGIAWAAWGDATTEPVLKPR